MSRVSNMPVLGRCQSGPTRASIRRSHEGSRDLVVVIEQLNVTDCDYDVVTVIDAINYYDTVRVLRELDAFIMPALAEVRGEHIRKELLG